MARSANESFARLFKGGGVQGRRPCPRSAERGTLLCFIKRRRGSKGEPSPGVPPFLYSFACAPFYWAVVDGPCCLSTPFLWCLPKETVSSRQRKALFYPGGSTIRVSTPASVVFTHLRPTWGGAGAGRGWMGQKGHKIPPLDIRLRLLYTFSALCATNSKEANRMMRTRINRSVMGISVFSGGPSRSACP